MKYDFNEIVNRKGTNCAKWDNMKSLSNKAEEDTLPFWVADMDFPCAPPIIDALHKCVDRRIFGYSFCRTPKYLDAVCNWFGQRYDWWIDRDDIVVSPGVVPAIGYLIELLTLPGDGVIVQSPVYYPFFRMIKNHNRVIVNNPLVNNDGYYSMDYDDLKKKALQPENKLLILCSPHNPVGRVWKKDELSKLVEICHDNGVAIISDEIHADLVRHDIKHTPLETIAPDYKENIFTCTSPSKTFNLAGLQISNIIIHNLEIKRKWSAYVYDTLAIQDPTPFSQCAAQTAYEKCEDWLIQLNTYIDSNILFLSDFVQKWLPKAKLVPPEGTYLAWLNISAYGYSNADVNNMLIEKAKVLLEDGTMFGSEGEGYMRINVACPRSILNEGLKRIAAVL